MIIKTDINNKDCLNFVKSLSVFDGLPYNLENICKVVRLATKLLSDSENLIFGFFTLSNSNFQYSDSMSLSLNYAYYQFRIDYTERKNYGFSTLLNVYRLVIESGFFKYTETIEFNDDLGTYYLQVTSNNTKEYYNKIYNGVISKDFFDVYVSYYDGLQPILYDKKVKKFVSDCFLVELALNRDMITLNHGVALDFDINVVGSLEGSLNHSDTYQEASDPYHENYFYGDSCNEYQIFEVDVNMYSPFDALFSVDIKTTNHYIPFNRLCPAFSINCLDCSDIEHNFLKLYSLMNKVANMIPNINDDSESDDDMVDYTQVLTNINTNLANIHSALHATVLDENDNEVDINVPQALVEVNNSIQADSEKPIIVGNEDVSPWSAV